MKILIIRFSSIGDIVLTTPVIRCVKQQLPGAEVHFLTKKAFAPILEHNPYIDGLHFLQDGLWETVKYLKAFGFDYIIDLHHNQRTMAIRALMGTRASVFNKLNVEKWLMVNFKVDQLPRVHIVDRYLAAATPLGVADDGGGLDYFIPKEQEIDLATLPETHRDGYVALIIGAKHATKQYPVDLLAEVCRQVPYPIILLGGPEDRPAGEQVTTLSENTLVYNACGQFSLHGSASLARQANVVVSNDTGLMHISAAFQKPIVSLWGNTIPEFGMFPYYGKNSPVQPVIMEVRDLPCRPCSKIGYAQCPRDHFKCMREIKPTEVAERIKGLW